MGHFLDGVEVVRVGPGHDRRELAGLIGWVVLDRDVQSEMGSPVCDDPATHTWFVAMAPGRTITGFAAAVRTGPTAWMFGHDYVRPGYRDRGIHTCLIRVRIEWLEQLVHDNEMLPVKVRAVCTPAGLGQYVEAGFTETGRRGRYTTVERTIP